MPRSLQWLFGIGIAALLVGSPAAYLRYCNKNYRNFRIVQERVLYRSGQLSLWGLKKIVHDHGIKTVITLREAHRAGDAPPDLAEEKFCFDQDINYHRFPLRTWEGPNNTVPAAENVARFLEIMDDPKNFPVLVHCLAGSHRTGAYTAVFRMEYEHWPNAEALEEMKECGYDNLDEEGDILGYLTRYVPRWKRPTSVAAEESGLRGP